MKNRILTFIIGILTGAIIMALVFLTINKTNENPNIDHFPSNEGGQIGRPNGNMVEPPDKPQGNMMFPE